MFRFDLSKRRDPKIVQSSKNHFCNKDISSFKIAGTSLLRYASIRILNDLDDGSLSPLKKLLTFFGFQVHINLGAGESEMSSPLNLKLNDLQWHTVKLIRNEAEIQLIIDNEHTTR